MITDKIKQQVRELRAQNVKVKTVLSQLNITMYDYRKIAYENWLNNKYPNYPNLSFKIEEFKKKNKKYPIKDFDYQDVINKFGPNPICYLSGSELDYEKFISLDHIVPSFLGGSNELDNLQLIHPMVNNMKFINTTEEIISMAKRITEYQDFLKYELSDI
jgi:hypothetical protein